MRSSIGASFISSSMSKLRGFWHLAFDRHRPGAVLQRVRVRAGSALSVPNS
jgi:hypothetical protein